MRSHLLRLLGSLLAFSLACLCIHYVCALLTDFSDTFEAIKARYDPNYILTAVGFGGFPCKQDYTDFACIYCNQSALVRSAPDARYQAFDETVVTVLQRYSLLEYIGCFDRRSTCFQVTLATMHWALDRKAQFGVMIWLLAAVGVLFLFTSGPYASYRKFEQRRYQVQSEMYKAKYKEQISHIPQPCPPISRSMGE